MVRFLLENSLGAWWAARHPESPLIKEFEYLRFDENGQPAAGIFEGWPDRVAEVTVMDPCCGSGHFLVEAFGMLWRMRAEEEGLNPAAAQDAVLQDNLFGLELDPRCVQIAMFAVALTAWKQGGRWRELPTPNLACSGIPAKAPLTEWTALADGDQRLEPALERLHALFRDANTLGSLIDPRRAAEMVDASGIQRSFNDVDFEDIAPLLEKAAAQETTDPATLVLGADAAGIARAAAFLSGLYTLIITNVPYLTRNSHASTLADFCDTRFPEAKHDLSTVFLQRSLENLEPGGSLFLVCAQNWLFMPRYERLRRTLLSGIRWQFLARLGEGAFQSPQAAGAFVCLLGFGNERPSEGGVIAVVDVGEAGSPSGFAEALVSTPATILSQSGQRENPDARILLREGKSAMLLASLAESRYGLRTGDSNRFIRSFWELRTISPRWRFHQGTPSGTAAYSGRDSVLLWSQEGGLHEYADLGIASLQGTDAWGRNGVVVKLTRDLSASLYTGESFDNNVAVVWPIHDEDLPAVWAFLSSPEFTPAVREIDHALKVMNATLLKVQFDAQRWRQVAKKEFPDGLPEPGSGDPTQWLFEGRPEASIEPLQVAVGRLLGYRWPLQPDSDDLDEFADRDGIVCLPAVAREQPASELLQTLLARAYGGEWTSGRVRELLERAGSGKKNLADWLRDDFFKHHSKVFANRPFVWHIWDGRKDGFSALVNYHRLDRAGLEKLTYTYLGDWIERQRADTVEGVAGADVRLAAARKLKGKLEAILEGEPPYDIYVRWKELHEQPVGWEPDLDDGVRLNIRPFVEAGVLRARVNVHWKTDRGKNPDGSERRNDRHYTIAEKREAHEKAGPG